MKTLIIVFLWLAQLTSAQAGLFDGQTVGYQYYFPTQSSLYWDAGTAVGGPGVTFNGIDYSGGTEGQVFISGNQIEFVFNDNATWTTAAFNGPRIYDPVGGVFNFSSVTLDPLSTMAGLLQSDISFDANNIYINWNGLGFTNGAVVILDVNGSNNMPEPASIALLASGILGFAATRRKKNQV